MWYLFHITNYEIFILWFVSHLWSRRCFKYLVSQQLDIKMTKFFLTVPPTPSLSVFERRSSWNTGEHLTHYSFSLSSYQVVCHHFGGSVRACVRFSVELRPSQQPTPCNLLSGYSVNRYPSSILLWGFTWHSLSEWWWSYSVQWLECKGVCPHSSLELLQDFF